MITATLVGAGDPQDVQIVVSEVPAGATWRVTGHAGDWSWTVPGGEGVGDGGQVVLLDNRAPGNREVVYRVETSVGVEARRNFSVNPRMENSIAGWTAASGAVQTAAAGGTRLDFASGGSGNAFFYQTAEIPLAVGAPAASSIVVEVPAGFPTITGLYIWTWAYGSNVPLGESQRVTLTAGQTVTLSSDYYGTIVAPAGTTGVRTIFYTTSAIPAGVRLIVRRSLVEKAHVLGAYFDGTTAASGDRSYTWAGAPNASESIEYTTVQESAPIIVPMRAGMVLQSLNGTHVVPVTLMDGSGDTTHRSRQARFVVAGRKNPVTRYDVTGGTEGQLAIEVSMNDSGVFQNLIQSGEPIVWRSSEDLRDLPPVAVFSYGDIQSQAVLHSWPPEGFRAWAIPYAIVDDPILDIRLGSASWDELGTRLINTTWDQFDARFTGMSWDELDRFDWANL